jgi:NADH dehydrogenase [ubiquinone] 1 alpha subcomplex assembly factor 7
MTALGDLIKARIARTGPISIASFMADCLMHPSHGYYVSRDPFGSSGDFITAPEISQMFGELIGLCLAQTWLDQGAPARFALVELGPGRGTLMADILRATAKVGGFHDALQLHLVETSPALRKAQARLLPAAHWHDDVTTLPNLPLFVVANEFFDALPIRQFVRAGQGWRERMIGLSAAGDGLCLGLSDAAPLAELADRLVDTKDGDIVETCPPLPAIIATLSAKIARFGGAALIIDYGDWQSLGDTWQALAGHAPSDPIAHPGQADLTAHVDFAAIAAHCAPLRHSRLTTQGVFLDRLGITARAQKLAGALTGPALDQHIAAHRRLTHPAEMGDLFKVMSLYPATATPPPGLDP